MASESPTPVIFRRWPGEDGKVIAIFPTLPGTYDPHTCSSYMHVGQHSSCDPAGLMAATEQCPEYLYRDLKRELEAIGYTLEVRKRLSRALNVRRRAELERMKP